VKAGDKQTTQWHPPPTYSLTLKMEAICVLQNVGLLSEDDMLLCPRIEWSSNLLFVGTLSIKYSSGSRQYSTLLQVKELKIFINYFGVINII
jgi:hypothetical protein